jgi:inosine-uridine nucleoside N-ribohydrolase
MNNTGHKYRFSWQIPLIGFGLTFLLGLGFSYSNQDIRSEVQSVGLVIFTVLVAIGSYYTVRAFRSSQRYKNKNYLKHAIAGLLSNLVLIGFITINISTIYAISHPANTAKHSVEEFKPSLNAAKLSTWIDTDPACGQGATNDVDDCWALMMALRSPELDLRGISTTFGNTKGETALQVAHQAIGHLGGAAQTPIYEGSHDRGSPAWKLTQGSMAIASMLRREKLTIIAQGPLTNIATVIINHPDLVKNIDRIVIVAGKQPGDLFHPGQQWWFHFRDFNIRKDTPAARIVLDSGIPLVLTPFELATNVTITRSDLDKLASGDKAARWLRQVSLPWMSFWEDHLHKPGFHPFDALAVGYVTMPELFNCKILSARIGFSLFLEPLGLGHDLEVLPAIDGQQVYYCSDVDRRFKDRLIQRLMFLRR